MRRLGAMAVALAMLPCAASAAPPSQIGCLFTAGFAEMRQLLPDQVGACLENARPEPTTGVTVQRTTGGMLVWRSAGNWTGFTNGSRTWVRGPFGVQERASLERFDWEDAVSPPPGQPALTGACTPEPLNDDPSRAIALRGPTPGVLQPAIWARSADAPEKIAHKYYTFDHNGDGSTVAVALTVVDDGGYKVRMNVYAPDGTHMGTLMVGAKERQDLFLVGNRAGQWMVQLWNYRPAEVAFHLEVRRA